MKIRCPNVLWVFFPPFLSFNVFDCWINQCCTLFPPSPASFWFCFTLIYTHGQMHKYAQVLGKRPDINLLACLALASSISIDQTTRRAENHKEMHHLNEEWLKDYVAGLYWETIAITLCIRWQIWSLLCYMCVHVCVSHWTVDAPSDLLYPINCC